MHRYENNKKVSLGYYLKKSYCLKQPHRKKSMVLKSGECGGHLIVPIFSIGRGKHSLPLLLFDSWFLEHPAYRMDKPFFKSDKHLEIQKTRISIENITKFQ